MEAKQDFVIRLRDIVVELVGGLGMQFPKSMFEATYRISCYGILNEGDMLDGSKMDTGI